MSLGMSNWSQTQALSSEEGALKHSPQHSPVQSPSRNHSPGAGNGGPLTCQCQIHRIVTPLVLCEIGPCLCAGTVPHDECLASLLEMLTRQVL